MFWKPYCAWRKSTRTHKIFIKIKTSILMIKKWHLIVTSRISWIKVTKIPNNKIKIRSFNGTHNDDYDNDALRGLPVNTCLQTINDTNVKNQDIYIMALGKDQMTMILNTSSKVHGFIKKSNRNVWSKAFQTPYKTLSKKIFKSTSFKQRLQTH